MTKEDWSPTGQVCWGWVREIEGWFGFIPEADGHLHDFLSLVNGVWVTGPGARVCPWRGISWRWLARGQRCRNTAPLLQKLCSVLAPRCVIHVRTPPGTGAGWGSLRHVPLHTKAAALDASSLDWLNFREKFAPLIKTRFA